MPEPKLYIIATPLGNRDDITLRAIQTLRSLNVFFAEDSREFLKLLDLYQIPSAGKEVHSYAKHNMKAATERALVHLRKGVSLGLTTDRGTPGISDPGAQIVQAAREEGFEVVPIPGVSAMATLVSVAGLSADPFLFWGFLPLGNKDRKEVFDRIERLGVPVCFFESPKRVRDTVDELKGRFPEGKIFSGREMTKVFESFVWTDLSATHLDDWVEKGEYALLLIPGPPLLEEGDRWEDALRLRVLPEKAWAKQVAERHGVSATAIYNALQKAKYPSSPKSKL
jgi:16S rRNA (cytidine1402-2'-O)-methyltransferase